MPLTESYVKSLVSVGFTPKQAEILNNGDDTDSDKVAFVDADNTFTGANEFQDDITLANSKSLLGEDTGGTARTLAVLNSSNDTYFGSTDAGGDTYLTADDDVIIRAGGATNRWKIQSDGDLIPFSAYDIGESTSPVEQIWNKEYYSDGVRLIKYTGNYSNSVVSNISGSYATLISITKTFQAGSLVLISFSGSASNSTAGAKSYYYPAVGGSQILNSQVYTVKHVVGATDGQEFVVSFGGIGWSPSSTASYTISVEFTCTAGTTYCRQPVITAFIFQDWQSL